MGAGKDSADEIRKRVRRKLEVLVKASGAATMLGALLLEREVKQYITDHDIIDTGRLRASYTAQSAGETSAVMGTNVEYAPDLEYGTSHQRAQPHLYPVFEANKDKVTKLIADRLKAALKDG